jgi:hypothetical protein
MNNQKKVPQIIRLSDPAAAANAQFINDSCYIWRILAVSGRFIASGTIANRVLRVIHNSSSSTGGVALHDLSTCPTVVIAGGNSQFCFAVGHVNSTATSTAAINQTTSLPIAFLLRPGDRLDLEANSIQAGDQFSVLTIQYEVFD